MSSSSETNFPRGGTSTQSTPANNIGEGSSGLGDPGYPKGSGPVSLASRRVPFDTGTILTRRNKQTTGQFNTLTHQKEPGKELQSELHPGPQASNDSTKEESSFMGHRPGGSGTLPGWDKLKDLAGSSS